MAGDINLGVAFGRQLNADGTGYDIDTDGDMIADMSEALEEGAYATSSYEEAPQSAAPAPQAPVTRAPAAVLADTKQNTNNVVSQFAMDASQAVHAAIGTPTSDYWNNANLYETAEDVSLRNHLAYNPVSQVVMAVAEVVAAPLTATMACTPPPKPCDKFPLEDGVLKYTVTPDPIEPHECKMHTTTIAANARNDDNGGEVRAGMPSAADVVNRFIAENPNEDVFGVLGSTDGSEVHVESIDDGKFNLEPGSLFSMDSLDPFVQAILEPAGPEDAILTHSGNFDAALEGLTFDGIDPRVVALPDGGFETFVSNNTGIYSEVPEEGDLTQITLNGVTFTDLVNGTYVTGPVVLESHDTLYTKVDQAIYQGPLSILDAERLTVASTTGVSTDHTILAEDAETIVLGFTLRDVDSRLSPIHLEGVADWRAGIVDAHVLDPIAAVAAQSGAVITMQPGTRYYAERASRLDGVVITGTGFGPGGAVMVYGTPGVTAPVQLTGIDAIMRGEYAYDINADGTTVVGLARSNVVYGAGTEGTVGPSITVASINTRGNPFDSVLPLHTDRAAQVSYGVLLQDTESPFAEFLLSRAIPVDSRAVSDAFVVSSPTATSPSGEPLWLYGDNLYAIDLVDEGAAWYVNQTQIPAFESLNLKAGFGAFAGPYMDEMHAQVAQFNSLVDASEGRGE